jgi:DNA-binding SARP family transcriptional activator
LLTLLWPDLELRRAQNVLRRNLSTLNKTLNGKWLVVERDVIGLDKKTDAWLDVAHFRHLAQSWQEHSHPQTDLCARCLSDLAQAASLYRADFMAGFGVRDSSNFDNWQLLESEQLKRELASVLARLVQGHSERREFDQAISYAQRWLALDPLHEPVHRKLMQLYAANGDRSAALRQYQNCVQLLEDELGVPPEKETTALYESLRQETTKHQKIIAGTFAIIDGDSAVGLRQNLIGSGGMGNVYCGFNRQSGDAVAIKVLKPEIVASNPDIVERFVREGQALRQLNHPNIVKMLSATEQDGQFYLVMEYVAGGSLKDMIGKGEPLPSGRAVDIALDLADALTRAHRLKIIHRDLKPANILLAEDGTPRLTDFGVARMVNSSQLTKSSQILGTIDYLSPEGCEGLPLDERADIWAFGVILYEMLTGEHPFKGPIQGRNRSQHPVRNLDPTCSASDAIPHRYSSCLDRFNRADVGERSRPAHPQCTSGRSGARGDLCRPTRIARHPDFTDGPAIPLSLPGIVCLSGARRTQFLRPGEFHPAIG